MNLVGYRELGRIARGSTADVVVAIDPRGKRVALKRPHPHVQEDDTLMRLFFDEIALQARYHDAHIAQVIDLDEDEHGAFAVLELIDGPTLSSWMCLAGPLSMTCVHTVGAHIATALASLHAWGVVHRDVAPANIVVDRSGRAVLVDFGIARRLSHGGPLPERQAPDTAVGGRRGRMRHQAPEQRAGGLHLRSDVYALALTLIEARCGVHPIVGTATDDATIMRRLQEGIVTIDIASDIVGVDWLQRDPMQRPSAHAVAEQLRADVDVAAVARAVVELGLPSLRA
jgi:eukaryotic-like serine/threonine-protein kinase